MKWLKDLPEETMYDHYCKTQPALVQGIRQLLVLGEKKSKIKKFIKSKGGQTLTTSCIWYMIDRVQKTINN